VQFLAFNGSGIELGVAMQRMQLSIFLLLVAVGSACAQDECHLGAGNAADTVKNALRAQTSCSAAAALLHKCAWGATADTGFAPIVIEKCEADFLNNLSAAGKGNYRTELQLCGYEYSRRRGTLYRSAASLCQADVAARFAANPEANDHAALKASFDCNKAQTLLGRAICSDAQLGLADIVLSRAYAHALSPENESQKAKLAASEQKWLAGLAAKCNLTTIPLPEPTLSCLRNEIEIRFTALDSCGMTDDTAACVDSEASSGGK
jgi:uncharacterized protein YecT (DUF1311 family)